MFKISAVTKIVRNPVIFVSFSIKKLVFSIEIFVFSIEILSFSIEILKVFIEIMSFFIEKMNIFSVFFPFFTNGPALSDQTWRVVRTATTR